jgi:hypothetical protein
MDEPDHHDLVQSLFEFLFLLPKKPEKLTRKLSQQEKADKKKADEKSMN